MTNTPPTDYSGTPLSPIDRIDSGETDESPFASNLVTPTDEEGYTTTGITERLDKAKSLLGYFVSRSITGDEFAGDSFKVHVADAFSHEPSSKVSLINVSEAAESVIPVGTAGDRNAEDEDVSPSPKSDNITAFPSVISSLSSSESILRPITGAFYNLPNDHIVVGKEVECVDETQVSEPEESLSHPLKNLTDTLADSLLDLLALSLRMLCFIPWCVAIGGALILAPSSLEKLAFGTGYVEPLTGIRRFSHWATYGFQHIVAFLTFIGAMIWFFPTFGYLILGGLLAQFCFEWHGFLENTTIPLGEDDQQTVYLLATTTWMNHDKTVNIKKIDDNYYPTKDPMPEEVDTDGGLHEELHLDT